ncbi:MAG: S8 family serine peptidase, partial [Pseudomonadota bacterium]
GPGQIVVGAYRWRDQSMSNYSGAAADGIRNPDLAAPADRSRVMGGVPAAAGRSGSVAALNGTSVAAPQVARALALALRDGPVSLPQFMAANAPPPAHPGPDPVVDARRGRGALLTPNAEMNVRLARSFR